MTTNQKTIIVIVAMLTLAAICFSQSLAPQSTNEKPALLPIISGDITTATMTNNLYHSVSFMGGVNHTEWLIVTRHNTKALDQKKGFDPCYTSVTSDFKPIVRKLANGKYEIEFTSEIAEKLP